MPHISSSFYEKIHGVYTILFTFSPPPLTALEMHSFRFRKFIQVKQFDSPAKGNDPDGVALKKGINKEKLKREIEVDL